MEKSINKKRQFSAIEKIVYCLMGALIAGIMWRIRGTHGWGSERGVMTVGMIILIYIYAVFKRKTNASFFHIVIASAACILTTPAWGTLLNQTSGFFEVSVKGDYTGTLTEFSCSPLSGVFIMLCLGFGIMPLFMFFVSRLFSGKKYSILKYTVVIASFFAVFYFANATVSHLIIKLIQPEAAKAFEWGLNYKGIHNSIYLIYLKHFSNINWGKNIPFGRNYFTEISVISHAIASLATILILRFGFKDKIGARITFWGCTAFSIGITASNVFFVLKNKLTTEKYPWIDYAWNFWEFFTGFISVLILMMVLFRANKKYSDIGFKDNIFPKMPEKLKDILLCLFIFCFGFGWTVISPLAVRLDESDILPIIVYAVGGAIILVFAIIMIVGKLPKIYSDNAVKLSVKLLPILFAIHVIYYNFVGYTDECPPNIIEINSIQILMMISTCVFFVLYLITKRKELFSKHK